MWNRSRLLTQLKTFATVTVVTVLIWLYAEGENVHAHEITFLVEFEPPPRWALAARTAELQPLPVRMTFRSTLGQLAEVQRRTQGGPLHCRVAEGAGSTPSGETVILRDWLESNSPLASMGINIDDVKPPAISVTLEPRAASEAGRAARSPDGRAVGRPGEPWSPAAP